MTDEVGQSQTKGKSKPSGQEANKQIQSAL